MTAQRYAFFFIPPQFQQLFYADGQKYPLPPISAKSHRPAAKPSTRRKNVNSPAEDLQHFRCSPNPPPMIYPIINIFQSPADFPVRNKKSGVHREQRFPRCTPNTFCPMPAGASISCFRDAAGEPPRQCATSRCRAARPVPSPVQRGNQASSWRQY